MNNNRNKSYNVIFNLRVAASPPPYFVAVPSPLLCRGEGAATRRLRYILSDDYDDMIYTLLLYTAFVRDRDQV